MLEDKEMICKLKPNDWVSFKCSGEVELMPSIWIGRNISPVYKTCGRFSLASSTWLPWAWPFSSSTLLCWLYCSPRNLKQRSGPSVCDHTIEAFPGVFLLGLAELASDHILHVWLFLSLFQAPMKHLILIKHSPPLWGPGRNGGPKETLLSRGLPELASDHSLFSRNNTNWVSLKLPHSPSHTLCGFCFSTATRYVCTQQGPSEQSYVFFSRGASWFFHSNRALTT